ncbi:MAG TPA: hypothetical protein VH643_25775 [Gemmataceae bacterium]|jgi:hypothetical protein
MTLPRWFVLLLPLFLAIALGCGHSKRDPSIASGKVTYKGQEVSAGTITFHPVSQEEGVGYGFPLKPEGYTAVSLPAEEMVVTVETESKNPKRAKPTYGPPGKKGPGGKEDYRQKMMEKGAVPQDSGPTGNYVQIPKKYADKKTSPLRATLTAGKHDLSFELKDN